MFYIVGDEGIEVWENTGAQNFPYRKQSYLSIPYHAPSFSDNFDDYAFSPPITARYRNDYVVIGYSSINNRLNILFLSGGKYKLLPFNFNNIYNFLENPQFSSEIKIVGFSIGACNFYGKEYIILNAINNTSLNTTFSWCIDENGDFSRFPSDNGSSQELSLFSNYYRVNGLNGLNITYDDATPKLTLSSLIEPFEITDSDKEKQYNFFSKVLVSESSEIIFIKKLVIKFYIPNNDSANVPYNFDILVYTSIDRGQNFTLFSTENFNITTQSSRETLIMDSLGTYDDVMIKLVTKKSLIIQSAYVITESSGVK